MKLFAIINVRDKNIIGARLNNKIVDISKEIKSLQSFSLTELNSDCWEPIYAQEYFDLQEALKLMKQGKTLGKNLMTGYTYKIENNEIHAYYKGKIDTDYDVNSIGFIDILDKQWYVVED